MKDSKREPLLEQLAKQYIDEDGRRLLAEAERLEENAPAPVPAVDGKVRGFRSARRRGHYVAAFGAVAAGLLLIFLLPRLEVLQPASEAPIVTYADEPATVQETHTTPPPETDAFAKSEALPEDAEGGAAPAMEPEQRAADMLEDAAPEAPAAAFSAAAPEAEIAYDAPDEAAEANASASAIIPLSFALPAGFTVDSVRQDEGETIYTLANAALDDVILSVEDAAGAPLFTEGLVAIHNEDGESAHGLAGTDVQFLIFEQNGLRYRLTCRHDIQTLLALWQHILSA